MDPVAAPHLPGPPAAPGAARPAPAHRRTRLAALAAGAASIAYVGLVDPGRASALYPPCPSRALFGLDCPGCGGLRGTHDLLHGDIAGALDHNLLLPFLLVAIAYGAVLALGPAFGRTIRPLHPPRWSVVTGALVLGMFTVLRNLPIGGLEFLASGTS